MGSKVVDFDQLYPGKFIKAGDFNGKDVTLEISDVRLEELEGEGGKKGKGIVTFKGAKKEWVLNRTNGECLKAMFGREVPKWIGKRVTLYPATITDSFTQEPTLAIRVRGSPDMEESAKSFSAKIGRKSVSMKVVKTGATPVAKKGPAPATAPTSTTAADTPSEEDIAAISAAENQEAPL